MKQEEATRQIVGWQLGQTSKRFETSGVGAGAISTGKNDHGGASYGTYQLSSKAGTLQEYLSQSAYGAEFKGLVPCTPAFDAKWRGIAAVDPDFEIDQHNFIGRSHYQEQLRRLGELGLSLEGRGRAVQDALWSTSVQFRNLTPKIVSRGLEERFGNRSKLADLTDRQIVEAIQDYKANHNEELFKSSPGLWSGLRNRAESEKSMLMALADAEVLAKAEPQVKFSTDGAVGCGQDAKLVERQQVALNRLGYGDAGDNPLEVDGRLGPDTTHAIKSFQRAHHLKVDGIVGKATRAALADAKRAPLLSEATHPSHHLYVQIVDGIRKLPADTYRNERTRTNAAVALTISADVQGLRKVDHVVLSVDGANLFAVQGRLDDPAHRRVLIEHAYVIAQGAGAFQPSHAHRHPTLEPLMQPQFDREIGLRTLDR